MFSLVPCRSGTGPEGTVLALGVDESILSSSQMSRQLVEDSVRAHDGVLLQVRGVMQCCFFCSKSSVLATGNAVEVAQAACIDTFQKIHKDTCVRTDCYTSGTLCMFSFLSLIYSQYGTHFNL